MSENPPKRVEGIVLDKDGTPINTIAPTQGSGDWSHNSKQQHFGGFSSQTQSWSTKSPSPWLLLIGATIALPLVLLFLGFLLVLFVVGALLGKKPSLKTYKRNL